MTNKVTRSPKPVKRYIRKKDAIGRVYVLDKTTGKRAANALWDREQKKLARLREKERQASAKRERAQRAAETRKRNRELVKTKAEKRRESARRGWETRRQQMAFIMERLRPPLTIDQEFHPLGSDIIEMKIIREPEAEGFKLLGPEYGGMPLVEKAQKYPKVQYAVVEALNNIARENVKMHQPVKEYKEYLSPQQWIRSQLFDAYLGRSQEFHTFEQAASAMVEEFTMSVREVYQLFFSPSVA